MAAKKRKKRANKGSWTHSVHEILGGKASIMKIPNSGEVWQFRMWIEGEQKPLRRSLRTKDHPTAIERAEKLVFETLSDEKTGRRIFGATLEELTQEYLKYRLKDVENGDITPGRLKTIESQMKHFLAYKDPSMKVAELDNNSYFDYAQWRKQNQKAKPVTIRNEQATFNSMIDYGYREGMSHIPKLTFRKIKIAKGDIGRRSDFTPDEYKALIKFLRSYVSKKECPDELIRRERLMIRDAVLIASNSLLRVGELFQLEWRDVKKLETTKDRKGLDVILVHLKVRKETSKNRSDREIICRGGEYFQRLKKNNKYTRPKDLLFQEVDGTSPLSKTKRYAHWRALMFGIGIKDYGQSQRNLTWYSLRHHGVGRRLRSGNSYEEISSLAGSGIKYIEDHYAHPDVSMKRTAALRNYSVDEEGNIVTD